MALPKPFDGYVEQPARVTTTALIHFQRNRYSVPCEWVNAVVSLRAYARLIVAPVRNAMEEATAAMRKIGEQ